jgi:hypothetical protein
MQSNKSRIHADSGNHSVIRGKPVKRLLDSDGRRERQLHFLLSHRELFPLEFWLHLWGNAKGVLKSALDKTLPIREV